VPALPGGGADPMSIALELVQPTPPVPYLGVFLVRLVVVAEQVADAVREQELQPRRHVPTVRLALALDVRHGQHNVAQVPQRLDRRLGLLARPKLLWAGRRRRADAARPVSGSAPPSAATPVNHVLGRPGRRARRSAG